MKKDFIVSVTRNSCLSLLYKISCATLLHSQNKFITLELMLQLEAVECGLEFLRTTGFEKNLTLSHFM